MTLRLQCRFYEPKGPRVDSGVGRHYGETPHKLSYATATLRLTITKLHLAGSAIGSSFEDYLGPLIKSSSDGQEGSPIQVTIKNEKTFLVSGIFKSNFKELSVRPAPTTQI